jgi:hypothetical protein
MSTICLNTRQACEEVDAKYQLVAIVNAKLKAIEDKQQDLLEEKQLH